jgi:anti-anti-sigma factor
MTEGLLFDTRIVEEDIVAVILRGKLDAITTPEFDREIRKHLDQGRSKIIIDCRHLESISSQGIGSLVALQTRIRRKGGIVKLAALSGMVYEVIRVVGLNRVLGIYGDLELARESFFK